MKNTPLVSIITPTYNHEQFIGQCIDSVLSQTYSNWEQIIIDDGSTDRTAEIITRYDDKRIKYIRQANIGIWKLRETYNKALALSKGELIAVLEGDDFWPPDKLEKQIPVFDNREVVLSFGKAAVTNNKGGILYITQKSLKGFKNIPQIEVLRKLLFHNVIPACTVMCRKETLLSIGGFQQPAYAPYVDYPTWLNLALKGEICPLDEIAGYWRRHENQMSVIKSLELAEAHNHCVQDFFKQMSAEIKYSLGITTEDLLRHGAHVIATSHAASGRINLLKKQWGEAKTNFQLALKNGTAYIKCMALVGILCCYLKTNLEWAAFLINKPRLNNLL